MKVFEIETDGKAEETKRSVEEMCRKLLANPVIHNYSIRIK